MCILHGMSSYLLVNWDPNEVLVEHCRSIRDSKGKVLKLSKEACVENNAEPVILESDAPLITMGEITCPTTNQYSSIMTGVYFSLCPFGECIRGSLMTYIEETMKNFIAQSILSIRKARSGNFICVRSSQNIVTFVWGSKELLPIFSTSCLQTLSIRKTTLP